MEADTQLTSLSIYQALASDTRLRVINLLAIKDMNVKELAEKLYMSSAMMSRHIKKLEEANLIKTIRSPGISGSQKICKLAVDQIFINFPKDIFPEFCRHTTSIRLGHFTHYEALPTCGLATEDYIVGIADEPKYFMDADRINSEILWFSQGFVEYKVPNKLETSQKPEVIEICFEISSEFPGSNNKWPSDITFYINNKNVGTWTVPGNFSDVRGKLNPKWWPDTNSQYGLLKTLRINSNQTNVDGEHISDITINDIDFSKDLMEFRFAVHSDAKNIGGLTIYGRKFGNHEQDIVYNLFYSVPD